MSRWPERSCRDVCQSEIARGEPSLSGVQIQDLTAYVTQDIAHEEVAPSVPRRRAGGARLRES